MSVTYFDHLAHRWTPVQAGMLYSAGYCWLPSAASLFAVAVVLGLQAVLVMVVSPLLLQHKSGTH